MSDPEVIDETPVTDPEPEPEPEPAPVYPEDSILNTIKDMLGPSGDYDAFDREILVHINSAFGRLCELGVGPDYPYAIDGPEQVWDEFGTPVPIPQVKRFVFLYVKRIFDPSANSVIMQAYKDEIDKLEWLMNSVSEVGY